MSESVPPIRMTGTLDSFLEEQQVAHAKTTQAEPTSFRDELHRNMPHDIQKAIRVECSDTFRFRNNRGIISIPQKCNPTFEPAAVEKAIDALHDYDDLDKDLTRHISILDVKLSSLRAHLPPIRELAGKMENKP